MLTPLQALKKQTSSGDPLPSAWKPLAEKGVVFRKGQVVLVCAGPGAGKSAFALNYAAITGTPCLYFSADSNDFTQIPRLMSILSGVPVKETEEAYRRLEHKGVLSGLNLRFDFRPSPTVKEIEHTLDAFWAQHEEFPQLVVVDNLQNVSASVEVAGEEMLLAVEDIFSQLHRVARERDVCVLVLHHVTGTYNDGDKPIPMSGIRGQVGRIPEIVLTVKREINELAPDQLRVSIVKNRGGRADPSGGDYVSLEFVAETMQINAA